MVPASRVRLGKTIVAQVLGIENLDKAEGGVGEYLWEALTKGRSGEVTSAKEELRLLRTSYPAKFFNSHLRRMIIVQHLPYNTVYKRDIVLQDSYSVVELHANLLRDCIKLPIQNCH
jgi:hypothetical protein